MVGKQCWCSGGKGRNLHWIWLGHKGKPQLEQGFAGCLGVRQADRAKNRRCKTPSESSAGARERRALSARLDVVGSHGGAVSGAEEVTGSELLFIKVTLVAK